MDKYLKNNADMMKTRTMTFDDLTQQKAKIIAAHKGKQGISELFRDYIETDWEANYKQYNKLLTTKKL